MDQGQNEQQITDSVQRSWLPCFQLHGVQGWVSWESDNDPISGPWDHDVVECLSVFTLPIFPRRAFHTYNWSSETYVTHFGPNIAMKTDSTFQAYPIRLTAGLTARCFLRRWQYVLAAGGLFAALLWSRLTDLWEIPLMVIGIGLMLFSFICAIWLKLSELRTKRIRRLLGRHQRGSSDPATWADAERAIIPESRELFGCTCYEDAVEGSLEKGDYSAAMWAARVSVVKEDRLTGERLTNRVLRHPDVKRTLTGAEENPKAWLEALRARRAGNEALDALLG